MTLSSVYPGPWGPVVTGCRAFSPSLPAVAVPERAWARLLAVTFMVNSTPVVMRVVQPESE